MTRLLFLCLGDENSWLLVEDWLIFPIGFSYGVGELLVVLVFIRVGGGEIGSICFDLGKQQRVIEYHDVTIEQMDAKIEGSTKLLKEQATKIEELTKLLKEQPAKHTEVEILLKAIDDKHNRDLKASNLRIKQLEKKVQNQ